MKPSNSKTYFEQLINVSGRSVDSLTAEDAIGLMLQFYREQRADNCPVDDSGDMLLFQWGAYDWGNGETYEYDITRQFILSGNQGDEGMSQLSLTIHFPVDDTLRAIKSGNHWCPSPADLDEFEKFISTQEISQVLSGREPLRVTLYWERI